MIQADTLLARLDGARQIGPDRWVARCPAHQDRTPSLSIRVTNDRILLFDFGGCEVSAILSALGLRWRDICPEDGIPYEQALAAGHRRLRQRLADIPAMEYARYVLLIAANDIEAGRELSIQDRATIEVAKDIIQGGQAHGI